MDRRKRPGIVMLIIGGLFTATWIGKIDFSHLRGVDWVRLSAIAAVFVCGIVMLAKNWRGRTARHK